MIIKITDIRLAGHCPSGAKQWFDDMGIDFRSFLKDGIDSETLLATGDGLAKQVVSRAKQRRGENENG